jgi:hypothetical protein
VVALILLVTFIALTVTNVVGLTALPWAVVVAPLATLVVLSVVGWVARYVITRRLEKQLTAELGSLLGGAARQKDRMEGGYL